MMPSQLQVVAQDGQGAERLLPWFGVLFGAVILIYLVISVARRLLHGAQSQVDMQSGFSIETVEEMHQRGEISDEEFKSLRTTTLGLDSDLLCTHNASSSGGGELDEEE